MKKYVALVAAVSAFAVLSGCSTFGVTVFKPVEKTSTFGIVQFADCPTGSYNDCPGSGKKVTDIYAKAFGATVIQTKEGSTFDMLITGKVIEYNNAIPFSMRRNEVSVDLTVTDKNGTTMATQVTAFSSGSLGSPVSLNESLANSLKYQLGLGMYRF